MKLNPILILICFFCFLINNISAQIFTFKFADPVVDYSYGTLCYDVEAQSDTPNIGLDEFNMRMYIDDCELAFHSFRNPDPNYFLETYGTTQQGVPGSGAAFFGFSGEFVYVIDNLKRVGINSTEIATAPSWTYLFEACFTGGDGCLNIPTQDEINYTILNTDLTGGYGYVPYYCYFLYTEDVCPMLLFDHDIDGSGFAQGSDGVEVLAVNPNGGSAIALDEAVINTSWEYYAPNPSLGECTSLPVLSIPSIATKSLEVEDCERIILSWEAEDEETNDSYLIEKRYVNELKWQMLATIKSNHEISNSKYEFLDDEFESSKREVFYRISSVDLDGQVTMLEIVSTVFYCDTKDLSELYPNPTNKETTIAFDIQKDDIVVTANIFNSSGKTVLSNIINEKYDLGYYQKKIDVSKLRSGQYTLQLIKGSQFINLPFQKLE